MKIITRRKHLEILGLVTLAQRQVAILEQIKECIQELTGDEQGDHTSDAVYGYPITDVESAVAQLLERLHIEVEATP